MGSSQHSRFAALIVLSAMVAVAGCGDDSGPGGSGDPAWVETLGYEGCFRLAGNDEGGDLRLGYSEGIIALDGEGNLWVGGHTYADHFAPFPIPAVLGATLEDAPVADQGSSWADVTQGVQEQIDGGRDVLGLLRVDGGWLYSVHEYYNGDGSHDAVLGYDGDGLWMTTHHSQAMAGYVAEVHPDWQAALGGEYIAGLAGTTIHQSASHGPVAHVFSLDTSSLPGSSDTVTTERLLFYPLYENHDDFTDVSAIRGAAMSADALYLFGRRGVGHHWYGEPDAEGNDPCGSGKGYHAEGRVAWVWIVDPADLEAVRDGGDPRVPTVFSGPLNELLGLSGPCTSVDGAAYDRAMEMVYLSTNDFSHDGMEPQPAIHVLSVSRL